MDNGVEYLVGQLKKRNLTDNTTILFYTDHHAYFNGLNYDMKNSGQDPYSFQIPAFISSPNIKNVKIEKFTNAFDLVPTVFQLLGIDLNSRFYLGNDAFGNDDSLVVTNGQVFNDKFMALDAIDILWQSSDATESDFKTFQTTFKNYQYKVNLFNILYDKGSPVVET